MTYESQAWHILLGLKVGLLPEACFSYPIFEPEGNEMQLLKSKEYLLRIQINIFIQKQPVTLLFGRFDERMMWSMYSVCTMTGDMVLARAGM